MAANRKPTGHFWTTPASFRVKWGTDYEMKWGAHKTQRLAIRYQNSGAGKPPEMFFDGKKIMATDKIESLGMYLDASGIPNAQHERVEKDIKVMRILVAKNYRDIICMYILT